MATAKVSIIIPVYNSGPVLKRTLDSVLSQTYTNFEVILIDDGSTDVATIALVDELKTLDSRIRVFHQRNCGLYATCDRGMQLATGDYVYVSGQDDYLHAQLFEMCVWACESKNLDYLALRWANVSVHEIPAYHKYDDFAKVRIETVDNSESEKDASAFCSAIESVHIDAWAQFLRRSLSLAAPSKNYGQITRTMKCVLDAKRWAVVHAPLYFYSVNVQTSIMHKPIYADWVNELHREMVGVYELSYAPRADIERRAKFVAICRTCIVPGLRTVFHLIKRSNKNSNLLARLKLWRAFAGAVADLVIKRRVPLYLIGFHHVVEYCIVAILFGGFFVRPIKSFDFRGSSSEIR